MQFQTVTCPHCGLMCDDLSVEVTGLSVQLKTPADPICKQAYSEASLDDEYLPKPMIAGRPASEEQALEKAAELLKTAQLPLVNGLIADIQTCREALALTEKLGGVIDHASGSLMRKSSSVMQRIGEVRTTLAEVRNRADCVVIFGKNVTTKFPRLLQRVLSPEKTLGNENTKSKKIFIIDISEDGKTRCEQKENITYMFFNYPLLESIIYHFQEIITKENISNHDKESEELLKLFKVISSSQYTTLIWTTSEFKLESAEHTVQALTEIIKLLMKQVRCIGLPLSGSKAEVTANHVATWQTGVPLPVSFTQGVPIHDPVIYDGNKMILKQETDCLLWIATYNPNNAPPDTDIPTIVLGHPKMNFEQADVYIPVGVPGIDHRGLACRADSVATLPLKKLRDSKLSSASVLVKKLYKLI